MRRRSGSSAPRRGRLPTARLILPLLLMLPATPGAQVWEQDRPKAPPPLRGETIEYRARGDKIRAYFVTPEGAGPHPGVVVIHEWWGLNDQVQRVADRLAGIGYAAIVPDLYRGKVPADAGLAHELMRALNEDWAVDVIKGGAEQLRARAKSKGVATMGFCMGGRLSLAAALKGAPIQAAVMYYGSVETDAKALAPLTVPLLGIFGRDDRGIPEADVRKFEAAMKAAEKNATIIVYPAAGHAFFNDQRASYEKEAADDAWARTQKFLNEHLKGETPPDPGPKREAPKAKVKPGDMIPDR